jgi:hypothetical protein
MNEVGIFPGDLFHPSQPTDQREGKAWVRGARGMNDDVDYIIVNKSTQFPSLVCYHTAMIH